MVVNHDQPTLDQLQVCFDDHHAVANAGLLLPATLAERLGIQAATDELVRLRLAGAAGAAKLLTVVHGMLAGGDCIDDLDAPRCAALATAWPTWALGSWPPRPWTVTPAPGRRAFTHPRCRPTRAAGHRRGPRGPPPPARRPRQHRPRHAPLHRRAHRPHSPRWRHRRAHLPGRLRLLVGQDDQVPAPPRRALLDHRPPDQARPPRHRADPGTGLTDICYPDTGVAQVAETRLKGDRLIVRRVRHLQAQAELFPTWQYDAFVTDRPAPPSGWTPTTAATPQSNWPSGLEERRGPQPLPLGGSPPTPPVLAATLAHNLVRWTAIPLGARDELLCAKTVRRTLLGMPGRLTCSARRFRLHLPDGWPWAHSFETALARLRCIPFAA